MSILIDKVRIKNFRSLKDVEIDLQPLTILVGANNAGKTTFLRALNAVLGTSRTALSSEDLFIAKDGKDPENKLITIDIRIVPVDENGKRVQGFNNETYGLFGGDSNVLSETDGQLVGYRFYAFRTIFKFTTDTPERPEFKSITNWSTEQTNENEVLITSIREGLNLFFLDAQRDLNDDIKQRSSFFGKQTTEIRESAALKVFEIQIDELNKKIVKESVVLSKLSDELSKLNQTIQNSDKGVSIKPLNSRIRDLHKGMKVEYQDNGSASFGMEYHGMGTRSWASILSFGAYVNQEAIKRRDMQRAYLPILALEEPEAHLHPNPQRTLYQQLKKFEGQKIVSTHSPYIAGQAELEELRHFYKKSDTCEISQILFVSDENEQITQLIEQIRAQISNEEKKTLATKIKNIKQQRDSRISLEQKESIKREIMQSKGELLFARGIVLFEGDTEEYALPVFAKSFLNRYPFELGLDFVGVGGKNNYQPFLCFAKILHIPCFILSDGDGDSEQTVKNQINNVFGSKTAVNCFVLPQKADFEKYLVDCGENYVSAIHQAIDKVKKTPDYLETVYIPDLNGQKGKNDVIRDYNGEEGKKRALIDCMRGHKTEFAYELANQIMQAGNPIPPKIKELFDKIAEKLNIQ